MRGLWWGVLVGCSGDPATPPVSADDPSASPIEAYDPLALVDPFIATGGNGAEIANINPGASVPFGLTHVGPDTRNRAGAPSFYHCAGYWYEDTHVHTFSHTHAHGMGVPDFGGVGVMPVDGWDPSYTTTVGRMAAFSHDQEAASPGWYEVTLENGIHVEITATLHGGHTRFTFPPGVDPVVLVDLGPSLTSTSVVDAWLRREPADGRITAFQQLSGSYSGRFGGLKTSVQLQVDPAPTGGGAWDAPEAGVEGALSAAGTSPGMWLRFPEGTTVVDLRAALSYVDMTGARASFDAELPDLDQAARRAEAEAAWRGLLERVRVRGGTEEERIIFHTALFHAAIMPRRQDDHDGRYRGLDGEIHTTDHPYYSDLSLWDTFRTLHPFYILAWPDVQLDVVRSLTRMTRDGGAMPRWPLGHGYTGGMVGSPATQVIVESWLKGLTDFDVETAWEGLVANSDGTAARVQRGGIQRYVTEGFVAVEDGGGSASNTLEYAWNDHALALWADALGRDSQRFWTRAGSWRNVWSDDLGFFTGRCVDPANRACTDDGVDDGFAWSDRPKPDLAWLDHYVEGNAQHYRYMVPQDVQGLIEVQADGDRDAFLAAYRDYWQAVYDEPDDVGTDDYYWHGNEPVMSAAFIGSLAGAADLTADAARYVLAHRYEVSPRGLDGNDDAGTLSAWYLLASMGIFPTAGTTDVALASPLFERVEVDRPEGTWVVRAPGTSDAVRYPAAVQVGGAAATTSKVDWADLVSDELVFTLSSTPQGWPGVP